MLPHVSMRARTDATRSDRLTRDRDHHDKKYHRHAPARPVARTWLTCGACSQAWPFSSGRLTACIGILPRDQPSPHDMIIVTDLAASSCRRFSHPADSHDLSHLCHDASVEVPRRSSGKTIKLLADKGSRHHATRKR